MSISVVLVVKNEEQHLARALRSAKFADEIIVVDMMSSDKTVAIAKKFTNKVFTSPKDYAYVEPARNFSLQKASGDWIFILDADEEITMTLAKRIKELTETESVQAYAVARKNLIFDKFIQYSAWWPDYQIRFFKQGRVTWTDQIHAQPIIDGQLEYLAATEELAIIHHNYQTVEDFVSRANRYTSLQAKERELKGPVDSKKMIQAFSDEFLKRFFAEEGIKDGQHGLALALLQANYELLIQLKQWQAQQFPQKNQPQETVKLIRQAQKDLNYWLADYELKRATGWQKMWLSLKRKLKL